MQRTSTLLEFCVPASHISHCESVLRSSGVQIVDCNEMKGQLNQLDSHSAQMERLCRTYASRSMMLFMLKPSRNKFDLDYYMGRLQIIDCARGSKTIPVETSAISRKLSVSISYYVEYRIGTHEDKGECRTI